MGKVDAATKKYLMQSSVFADIFNFYLYEGQQVIHPGQLRELDPAEISMPYEMCIRDRRYSRKGAMAAFRCEEVILDLERQGVVLGKKGKADVAEESRFAYKDIEEVMENQKDLVIPLKRLKTIGVVKG